MDQDGVDVENNRGFNSNQENQENTVSADLESYM